MKKLMDGFVRFRQEVYPGMQPLFQMLSGGQHPRALFVTCSDSRVEPSLLMQADPGDLFICRNAGNIVPPWGDAQGGVTATIEYAVQALSIPHIVICGHSDCGAVKAMLHPEKLTAMPTVAMWLNFAESARRVVTESCHGCDEDEMVQRMTFENVLTQITNLSTHPSVASALARGSVKLHGWVYNFERGQLVAFDAEKGDFVELTAEAVADMPHATPKVRRASYSISPPKVGA